MGGSLRTCACAEKRVPAVFVLPPMQYALDADSWHVNDPQKWLIHHQSNHIEW